MRQPFSRAYPQGQNADAIASDIHRNQAAFETALADLRQTSPDANPIEKLFSKLKNLLRKAAKRSTEDLWKEIGLLLFTVSAGECANYFASSGYVIT